MANARRLAELGMVPPLAAEVARQINLSIGNARRLMELSMTGPAAKALAGQINARTGNTKALIEAGLPSALAAEITAQIGGDGFIYLTNEDGAWLLTPDEASFLVLEA